jgi:hypothetical protein
MLFSLLIILLITFGGTALTYFYEKEDSLLVRLCAGNVIGSAIFGTICFVLACFLGLSAVTILLALAVTLLPLLLLSNKENKQLFTANLNKAKGKFEGANIWKLLSFAYYALFFIIFVLFFERAMLVSDRGILTGASQNLGDLPFHLGAIFSFTEGNNFPPENPSFANAKFTYPFIADFIAACIVKFGVHVRDAMFWQNVTLAFSLVVLLEKFTLNVTKNKLASKIAPFILFFSGGLGFVWFARDFWQDGRSYLEFLWNLKQDYTIRSEGFRWGNSLVVLFITQRGLLLGMPLTLIILTKIYQIFFDKATEQQSDEATEISSSPSLNVPTSILIGLLAGTLPLIHVHSLVVLFVVCACWMIFSLDKLRTWIIFGVSVSLIAIPELIWTLTGSATRLSEFVGWHFGWNADKDNVILFYIKNFGLFIPLLIFALVFNSKIENQKSKIIYYLPFILIFTISNIFKLAPWEWDNIKVLVYWFIGSIPFVALVLANLWEQKIALKVLAVICLGCLCASGKIDIWRVISRQINYEVFKKDSVLIAEEIKSKLPPNALFLNAPTYNSAVVLSGRRSFMRYNGHLLSYGIDYMPRENEVKRIYEGSGLANELLRKNNIEYVLISPEEYANLDVVNLDFFDKFPKIIEVGEYKVYKVK